MNITINIPDRDWYTLAEKADMTGVKISDVIVTAMRSVIDTNPRRIILSERVTELVKADVPDPVIAQRLGITVQHAAELRRAAGLKPVKFRRQDWERELLEGSHAA